MVLEILLSKKIKDYYFKFWYILSFKYKFKDILYKNFWFSTLKKKHIKRGNAFQTSFFWELLCKFFKKNQLKPLDLILTNYFNLNYHLDIIMLKKSHYILYFPGLLTFIQRFSIISKFFFKGIKKRKDTYFNNFLHVFFFTFLESTPAFKLNRVNPFFFRFKRLKFKYKKRRKYPFLKFNFKKRLQKKKYVFLRKKNI